MRKVKPEDADLYEAMAIEMREQFTEGAVIPNAWWKKRLPSKNYRSRLKSCRTYLAKYHHMQFRSERNVGYIWMPQALIASYVFNRVSKTTHRAVDQGVKEIDWIDYNALSNSESHLTIDARTRLKAVQNGIDAEVRKRQIEIRKARDDES